ncbi:hypothetical protein [Streptomyces lutosisoli]|uniref:Uncharacterized protein n=1 Tax=Streptomyces lutosisoli TaxID=2665721 RepID=A0ABW2VU62_9ACTN
MTTNHSSDNGNIRDDEKRSHPTFWSRLLISMISRLIIAAVLVVAHHE